MGKTHKQIEVEVAKYISEAKKLLPGLPSNLSIVWDRSLIIPGNGTGGTLIEPNILGIGYDPDFKNRQELLKHLRSTVLHECFHALQGWSDKNPAIIPKNLLEDGILEGAATVFEKEFGKTSPPWGLYEDDETMKHWLGKIKDQQLDPRSTEYNEYKFGKVDGVNWMLYKLGTWITKKALKNNPKLSIVDLANYKPEDIMKLSQITN